MQENKKQFNIILFVLVFSIIYLILSSAISIGYLIEQFTLATLLKTLTYTIWLKAPISAVITQIIVDFTISGNLDFSAKVVGNGQHGTARWSTPKEFNDTFTTVVDGKETVPGFYIGRKGNNWLIDTSDNTSAIVSAPGGGKTKTLFIPNIIYNALVNKNTGKGASMIFTDVKGELLRTTNQHLKECGYTTYFLDFRNPLNSYKFNLMSNVNKAIDKYLASDNDIDKAKYFAKAERHSKTLASSIVDNIDSGLKSEASEYFNETAKGLIISLILLVSLYGDKYERHIISVFHLIIEMNGLENDGNNTKEELQKNKLDELLKEIGNDKLIAYAGASMKADVKTSMNIFSSALGKLASFIDSELEQMVCFHTEEINDIDFIKKPTAIFLICPDENTTRHFFASLFIRYFLNDLIEQAEENNGILNRPVQLLWDEFGNMPPIKDIDIIFTAIRSRGVRALISLQSFKQLEKNYTPTKAKIIMEAIQMTYYTYLGTANTETAKTIVDIIGSRTIQSGSKNTGKHLTTTKSMTGRQLMTIDEINSMPKGDCILIKNGHRPFKLKLKLYTNFYKLKIKPQEPLNIEFKKIYKLDEHKLRQTALNKKIELYKGMFD